MQSLFQRSLTETNSGEEDTRSRILQAALRLFAAKGYEGTTTKDLAGSANVAEGTLFRYFPNKKAILIEVATRGWVDIWLHGYSFFRVWVLLLLIGIR